MSNVTHEVLIQEHDDGSHTVKYNGTDPTTFVSFIQYMLKSEYFEHLLDVLPGRFRNLLEQGIQGSEDPDDIDGLGECGDPDCPSCGKDSPVMYPSAR